MVYLNELERMSKELKERKADLMHELNSLPDGYIMCTDQEDRRRYFQRIPAKGNRKKERRYGIKNKPDILCGLVRKKYVEAALKNIDLDILTLDTTLRSFAPVDENTVMASFITRFPELTDSIYKDHIYIEEWKNAFERIDGFHPENLKQIAADGTRSRSKNELYIASRLDHYDQIYRSDCPTGIHGLYRVPDFTILRKSDRKVIYWEHMGMMDNLEYRIDNKRKLEEYEAHGIVPWDNLIITYDTVKGGLRANMIEAMIQSWLLQ